MFALRQGAPVYTTQRRRTEFSIMLRGLFVAVAVVVATFGVGLGGQSVEAARWHGHYHYRVHARPNVYYGGGYIVRPHRMVYYY